MRHVTTIAPLNLQRPNALVIGHAKQDDKLSRWYQAQLLSGDAAWIPPAGVTAMIRFRKPDGHAGWYDSLESGAVAVTWTGSVVTMGMHEQVLTCPGNVLIDLEFSDATGILTAFSWTLHVEANVLDDADLTPSSDAFVVLAGQVAAVNQAVADAQRIVTGVILSNKNLLTNWDWRRAVNQRASTSYSASSAEAGALDRCIHRMGTLELANGTWTWTSEQNTYNKYLRMHIDSPLYRNTTYTLTVYARASSAGGSVRLRVVDSTGHSLDGAPVAPIEESAGYSPYSITFTPTETIQGAFAEIWCGNTAADYVTILPAAWKLELGSEQTLVRRVGSAWVVYDEAVYDEELIKCQRYFVRVRNSMGSVVLPSAAQVVTSTSEKTIRFALPLSVPLASTPTITKSGNIFLVKFSGGAVAVDTIDSAAAVGPSWVMLYATTATAAENGFLYLADAAAYIDLSCD